ncbi:uncharacterized protein LOC132312099 [Cornus florida]|uniref:uncharacterized protein LOC132312099 n=1 Tax=Cornus florida TaxID=4283 RepID=UPI00289F4E25|nr:uncharacterized protein LOC132312099 [Cornus florida]
MGDKPPTKFHTSIHIAALDGIVHVNSLFTLAVFVGLAWDPSDPNNRLVEDPLCAAGNDVAADLITFHVFSFSSFLFSSLVALGLKQALRMVQTTHLHVFTLDMAHVNKTALRVGYLVSAAGSVSGCLFLMMALVDVVQIKLGTLSCGSSLSYGAIVPLMVLVPCGLSIYVCFVLHAFAC